MSKKKNLELSHLKKEMAKALSLKNFEEAKTVLEKMIKINPSSFELYNNLGAIYLNLKKIDDAIKNFKKSIELNTKFLAPYVNLAQLYLNLNDKLNAIYFYEKIVKLNKNYSLAYYNLGNLYKSINEIKKAEINLEKAIEIDPNMLDAYNNLFEIFDRSNQIIKLEELLEKLKNQFKKHEIIDFFSGILQYKKKNFAEVIKIFNFSSLENLNLSKKVYLLELVGKSYDKLKDFDNAFLTFQKVNNLVSMAFQEKIDKKVYLDVVQKKINFFSKLKKDTWNKLTPVENLNSPVFLVGFPRSGTTLLDTLLSSHPSIEVIEEKPIVDVFIAELEKKIGFDHYNLNSVDENLFRYMRKFYFDTRSQYIKEDNNKLIVDKLPLNIIHVGEIFRFFPESKFIFSLRNPYDVILSCFIQQFAPNPAMLNLTNINDAVRLYDLVMNLWFNLNQNLNINLFTIKYENIVENFDISIKKVLNFLNLKWSDTINDYRSIASKRGIINTPSNDQVIKPIYNNSVNRWKNYEKYFSEYRKVLDNWSSKFGY